MTHKRSRSPDEEKQAKRPKETVSNFLCNDCLVHLLSYCTACELAFVLPRVCQSWSQLIQKNDVQLWKPLCFYHWPILSITQWKEAPADHSSWRQFFKERTVLLSPSYQSDFIESLPSMAKKAGELKMKDGSFFKELARQSLQVEEIVQREINCATRHNDKRNTYNLILLGEEKDETKQQKLEELFLSWFGSREVHEQEANTDDEEQEYKDSIDLRMLGPSGLCIQISWHFFVEGWLGRERHDRVIRTVMTAKESCDVILLAKAEQEQGSQSADEEEECLRLVARNRNRQKTENHQTDTTFLSDVEKIHRHLGLQSLSLVNLWNILVDVAGQVNEHFDGCKRDIRTRGVEALTAATTTNKPRASWNCSNHTSVASVVQQE